MKTQQILAAVVTVLLLTTASQSQAGTLERFRAAPGADGETIRPHPICGIAGWRTEVDALGGESLRLPTFRKCRHLLAVTGWISTESPAELLLGEVLRLIGERAIPSYYVQIGDGQSVNLAVAATFWAPAGCESLLGVHLILTAAATIFPGQSRPPNWARCQNRAVEIFVEEYPRHPEVLLLNRLSSAIDAIDLNNPADLLRLHRVRLLLSAPESLPSLAELVSMIEGKPAPLPEPPDLPVRVFPFRFEPNETLPVTLDIRGSVSAGYAVKVRVDEGKIQSRALADLRWPVMLDAGLCYQLIQGGGWAVMALNWQPGLIVPRPPPGEAATFQSEFTLMTPPNGINVSQYWVCFRIAETAGPQTFYHASDAAKKGCTTCR